MTRRKPEIIALEIMGSKGGIIIKRALIFKLKEALGTLNNVAVYEAVQIITPISEKELASIFSTQVNS